MKKRRTLSVFSTRRCWPDFGLAGIGRALLKGPTPPTILKGSVPSDWNCCVIWFAEGFSRLRDSTSFVLLRQILLFPHAIYLVPSHAQQFHCHIDTRVQQGPTMPVCSECFSSTFPHPVHRFEYKSSILKNTSHDDYVAFHFSF